MGGLFVDPAPSERVERPAQNQNGAKGAKGDPKNARAADRRREEGRAPEPQGPKDTSTALKPGGPNASASQPTLSCVRGPETGVVLSLGKGSFTVGRGRENELVLKDIAASRKHLRIDVDGRRVRLVDLGSGNGTRVNGKRAGEVELRHGDTIEIGGSMLVFAEPGRSAPPVEPNRDDAQARVVAAADELARDLSARLRFGADDSPELDDGHAAKTRAIRSADARPRDAQEKQPKNDRLWNETFTNLPLSAVVPADHSLQGGGGGRNEAPAAPARQRSRVPSAMPQRSMAPVGTALDSADGSVVEEFSESGSRGGSFVKSVLLSAAVVVVVGGIALGFWAIFFKDEGPAPEKEPVAAVAAAAEREAEYSTAVRRAQDAYARADWLAVREYAVAALQVKPNDVMATTYQHDADLKLSAALAAASQQLPPARTLETTAPPAPVAPASAPVVEASPPAAAPAPAAPQRDPPRAKPKPKPRSKASKSKGLSEAEAKAQFERAIDAFRSKDNDTGCSLLDRVADRAPADSSWKAKADSLYLKKCGG